MSDINLIPQKQTGDIRVVQALRLLRIFAFVTLGITVLISAVIFLLIVFSPLSSLKTQASKLTDALSQKQALIAQHAVIENRLDSIDTVLKQRAGLASLLSVVLQATPPDITISSLSLENSGVHITFSTPSLDVGDLFLQNLIAQVGGDKKFSRLVLNNISFDNNSHAYLLTLQADLL